MNINRSNVCTLESLGRQKKIRSVTSSFMICIDRDHLKIAEKRKQSPSVKILSKLHLFRQHAENCFETWLLNHD